MMALPRTVWGEFPDVFIHADERIVKRHPDYLAAKTGFSAKLRLDPTQLHELRMKHGDELEVWWRERFGYGFNCLTQSEARYLAHSPDAHTIRNRIIAAEQARNRPSSA